MWRDRSNQIHLSADDARGGEIVLHTPRQRLIFLSGLAGALILGLALLVGGSVW